VFVKNVGLIVLALACVSCGAWTVLHGTLIRRFFEHPLECSRPIMGLTV